MEDGNRRLKLPFAFRLSPFLDEQLDDQVRKLVAGPGVWIEWREGNTIVHATKIMDWTLNDWRR